MEKREQEETLRLVRLVRFDPVEDMLTCPPCNRDWLGELVVFNQGLARCPGCGYYFQMKDRRKGWAPPMRLVYQASL